MTTDTPVKVTCHCKAVELSVDLDGGLDTARRCDCSYCRRRGAIMVTALREGVRVVRGANSLRVYQFGTGTAKHYFCGNCGCYTHHRRRSNPDQYGINTGCIEGINPRELGDVPWLDGVNHPTDRV